MSPPPALSRATVDRAADRRSDAAWLAEAWQRRGRLVALDREYRVLVVDGAASRSDGGTDGAEAAARRGDARADAPALHLLTTSGELPEDAAFLGEDAEAAYFTRRLDFLPAEDGARPALLREVGAALDDRDSGLLVHAVALLTWLSRSPHCPRCGARTEVRLAGALRVCPVDGTEHHPRTDPAMIVLVTSADGERAVLGRNNGWPDGLYSCLAGFVEPGESAEQCVAREVAEEVGLPVSDIRYSGSQPWPFPSSLMLAFTATAAGEQLTPDPAELSDARWFRRDELRTAVEEGRVWLPPGVSIARRLIDGWLEA